MGGVNSQSIDARAIDASVQNQDERRIDPMLGGKAVTYTEMCSGLHDQKLTKDQLEAHWGNLKKVENLQNPGLEIKRIRRLDPSDSGESTHSMALTSLSRMGLEHADIPIAQKIGQKKFKYLDANGKEISKAEAMDKAGGVAFYQDAAAPTKGRL